MRTSAVAAQILVALFTVALPLGGMLLLRRRASWRIFFIGAAAFVLSALVLERIFHSVILATPMAVPLQNNIWLLALYGGLAAGLFEETGRLAAFQFITKWPHSPDAAISYGLGHGGIEAVLLVGLTMVNNLIVAAMASGGAISTPDLAAAAEALAGTPAHMFLWAGFERIGAMTLHIANSILVYAAVERRRYGLYALAIATHTLINFAAVIMDRYLPIAATELLVLLLAVLVLLFALTERRPAALRAEG